MAALLEEFQQVGRDLYAAGLVSSHGGNLSVRQGDGLIITSHGSRLGHLEESDLVEVMPGLAATAEPSMDLALHQAIYAAVSEAEAIVHAHPRHAIALSLLAKEIRPQDLEGEYYLGLVPVVPRGEDVAHALADALRQHKIVVVAGHGSYARGESLWQALQWTSVLEESTEVLWLLRALGQKT
ncbi:MAG: class II aldolase/adducin family protein [Dehalococcoidia bacterium]